MTGPSILHETATRLRLAVPEGTDADDLAARVRAIDGVQATRPNSRLGCIVVQHDGRPESRAAVLAMMEPGAYAQGVLGARPVGRPAMTNLAWVPAAIAAALPFAPSGWQPGAALGVVAARVLTQRERLARDAPAVLLDAASLAALAVSGQPLVVSASVLARQLSEVLSARMVRESDRLLEHLLPEPAGRYRVAAGGVEAWRELREIAPGDTLRMHAGEVVPVDGCVAAGAASLHPVAWAAAARAVEPGAHVAAGERVLQGAFELRAESDAAGSRLQRLHRQLVHAIGARDPAGRLSVDVERLISLPLTGAALVLGLTGDRARAAAMLQADPQQGLDLTLPVAREATLVALGRQGLVTAGLETLERLARARALVLQDTGVLASGRWVVEAVAVDPAVDGGEVRQWLAELAGTPLEALERAGLPDLLVRQWVRHGALRRRGESEWHLAAPRRLRGVWGLTPEDGPALSAASADPRSPALRRVFAVVAGGVVVARVALASPWREAARQRLSTLRALGFDRVALFVEDDGAECPYAGAAAPLGDAGLRLECLADDPSVRGDWLAAAVHEGEPLVMLHTVLRDLVPPGSLGLTTPDADAGSHGILLGDPLADLETARRLASSFYRRLRRQRAAATAVNALLMTASALRWLPPMATALVHHGFAMLLLLDSARIESLGTPVARRTEAASFPPRPPRQPAARRARRTRRSTSP